MKATLLCFDRDLRLCDRALLAAMSPGGAIVPTLIIDRRRHLRIAGNARRAGYYCAAVAALDAELRARGSQLLVRRGALETTIRALLRATGAGSVAWSARYDPAGMREDLRMQAIVEEYGARAIVVHDALAVDPERLHERGGERTAFRSFRAFEHAWRMQIPGGAVDVAASFVRTALPCEPLPSAEEFGGAPMLAPVGEAIAREVLERFVREDLIGYARAIRTPAVATSGIGALLSYGLLSAREVVQSVRLRVEDPFILAEERASTELFLRAMARRDFYLLGAAANEERAPEEALFSATHAGLEAWTQGRTGFPLVDAGMRELRATGSMHPAVRAVAASFCCFDLGVDWRRGMEAWEEHLVEDEPALAAGNWRTSAGLAADLHFPRIYDPQRQFLRTDPQARYVRRWVPELGLLTDARQLRTERGAQGTLDLFQTQRYPAPILDHKERARNFLARYAQVRATALQAAGR